MRDQETHNQVIFSGDTRLSNDEAHDRRTDRLALLRQSRSRWHRVADRVRVSFKPRQPPCRRETTVEITIPEIGTLKNEAPDRLLIPCLKQILAGVTQNRLN